MISIKQEISRHCATSRDNIQNLLRPASSLSPLFISTRGRILVARDGTVFRKKSEAARHVLTVFTRAHAEKSVMNKIDEYETNAMLRLAEGALLIFGNIAAYIPVGGSYTPLIFTPGQGEEEYCTHWNDSKSIYDFRCVVVPVYYAI